MKVIIGLVTLMYNECVKKRIADQLQQDNKTLVGKYLNEGYLDISHPIPHILTD